MTYQPGQRVALLHTTDPDTRLRPGDLGTVRGRQVDPHTVDVDWDRGFPLTVRLAAGDRIRALDDPTAPPSDPTVAQPVAGPTLAAVAAAGTAAGHAAAEWWAQDTIGGRVSGDVTATARRVLAGINDGDPAILDTLPHPDPAGPDGGPRGYAAAGADLPAWSALTTDQRDAYHDAYITAMLNRVGHLCRTAINPDGDLSHLHPRRLRIGGVGVFAGDWAQATAPDGTRRSPVGYVGTLVGDEPGGVVSTCTRSVAKAIVADQHRHRDDLRRRLRAGGLAGQRLDQRVDDAVPSMTVDGDTLIVRGRAVSG